MSDVMDYIPHREPFLFIDEIVEMTDERIIARKKIDPSADFFRGHYPGSPIMPGVLLCEAIFQSGACLISKLINDKSESGGGCGVPVLTRIQNAKFKHIVRPGDTIEIESSVKETLLNVFYMKGSVSVGGRKAVYVEYACCLTEA